MKLPFFSLSVEGLTVFSKHYVFSMFVERASLLLMTFLQLCLLKFEFYALNSNLTLFEMILSSVNLYPK